MNGRTGNAKRSGSRRLRLAAAVVAAVVTVLGAASCADRPAPVATPGGTEVSSTPVATIEPTRSPAAESPKPDKQKPDPTESAPPTPSDPYALADGLYPAFIRDVDVDGATITVDVVQTFEGWRAKAAAIEDGVAPWKARQYKSAPVYIRNENPLLRTLPVSAGATFDFWGECEDTAQGPSGLRELAQRALPYSTTWYYSLTMHDGIVVRVVQHIAISAC